MLSVMSNPFVPADSTGVAGMELAENPRERLDTAARRQRYERVIDDYMQYCFNCRTAPRVTELALFLGKTHPNVCRDVGRVFGRPLGAILRQRQLARAAELLLVSPLTIEKVAEASAYGHLTTFYRVFRGTFGMTPGLYRQNARALE